MDLLLRLMDDTASSVGDSSAAASGSDAPFISSLSIPGALLISLVCVVVVILILTLIILICDGVFAGISGVDGKFHINAKKQNKILDEDPDAAVALIAATIDFNKETGKNARVVSIKKID